MVTFLLVCHDSTVFIVPKIRRKGTTQNYIHRIRLGLVRNCHNFSQCISINPFIRYELILFKFKFMSIPCTKLFDASKTAYGLQLIRLMQYGRPLSMPMPVYCCRRCCYSGCKVTLIDLLRFWSTLGCWNGLAFSIDRTKSISFLRGKSDRGARDGEKTEGREKEMNRNLQHNKWHRCHSLSFTVKMCPPPDCVPFD